MHFLLFADLYGEASGVLSKLMAALQTQLGLLAAITAIVLLTPNTFYSKAWHYAKLGWNKFWYRGPVTPAIPPGITPAVIPQETGLVIDMAKIKTSQDLKKLYDDFRKAKQDRITELKVLLAREEQELRDLDVIQVTTSPATVEVAVTA